MEAHTHAAHLRERRGEHNNLEATRHELEKRVAARAPSNVNVVHKAVDFHGDDELGPWNRLERRMDQRLVKVKNEALLPYVFGTYRRQQRTRTLHDAHASTRTRWPGCTPRNTAAKKRRRTGEIIRGAASAFVEQHQQQKRHRKQRQQPPSPSSELLLDAVDDEAGDAVVACTHAHPSTSTQRSRAHTRTNHTQSISDNAAHLHRHRGPMGTATARALTRVQRSHNILQGASARARARAPREGRTGDAATGTMLSLR